MVYECAYAQGGHPQYLVPAAGVLLLKLATFDRSVTEAKQHLLSITRPLRGRGLGIIKKPTFSAFSI